MLRRQWTPGKDADTQSVLASAAPGLVPSGALAAPTILSMKLPAGEVNTLLERAHRQATEFSVVWPGLMLYCVHMILTRCSWCELQASATLLLADDFQEVVYWQVVARGCVEQTAVGDVALIYPHAPPTI